MKHYIGQSNPMHAQLDALANDKAQHFAYAFEGGWNYPGDAFVQVAGLVEARARLEIEVTAVLPD